MQAGYLYLNAALYLIFAVLCSVAPSATAQGIGYTSLSSSGRSEYLVVYGGLQLGLALVFWMLARDVTLQRVGVVLALAMYVPIVVYRLSTMIAFWPVAGVTVATGCLEIALLLGGVIVYAGL